MWFSIACYVRPAGYSIRPPILINCGWPKVAREARTDFSMVMGALLLLLPLLRHSARPFLRR